MTADLAARDLPGGLKIVPVTKTLARQFVQEFHRHNEAPSVQQVYLAIGLEDEGDLVAVATAGRPVARLLDDGLTLEVNRACVRDMHPNANSMLYGALARAAKALGYEKVITYTLESESGASLRAVGFGPPIPIKPNTWNRPNTGRYRVDDVTLWGERRQAQGIPKYRWEKRLVQHAVAASSDAPGFQSGEGGSQPTPPLHSESAA